MSNEKARQFSRKHQIHSFDELFDRLVVRAQMVDLEQSRQLVAVARLFALPRVGEQVVIDGALEYITGEVGEISHIFTHQANANQVVLVGLYKVIRRRKGAEDGESNGDAVVDEPAGAGVAANSEPAGDLA